MSPTPEIRRRPGSKTGVIPRIDLEPEILHEPPPPPPTLPELDDDGQGVTGMLPHHPEEGDDRAKQADDSPSTTVGDGR